MATLNDVVGELFEALPGEAVYELNRVMVPIVGAMKTLPATFIPDEFGIGNILDISRILLKGMPDMADIVMDIVVAVKESKILEKMDLVAIFKVLGPAIEALGPESVLEFLVSVLNQLGGRTVKISMALLSGLVELSRPIIVPLVSIVLRIPLVPELVGVVVGLVPGLLEVVGVLFNTLKNTLKALSGT